GTGVPGRQVEVPRLRAARRRTYEARRAALRIRTAGAAAREDVVRVAVARAAEVAGSAGHDVVAEGDRRVVPASALHGCSVHERVVLDQDRPVAPIALAGVSGADENCLPRVLRLVEDRVPDRDRT